MKKAAHKPTRRGTQARRVAQAQRVAKQRTSKRVKQPAVLKLPAHFDIRGVGEIAEALRDCASSARPVLIDAGGVTTTDTAGLQLLLAARRAAQARAITFEWRAVSEALRATSAIIGLSEALGLP